jgi:acetaldehyde dehydrogenase/alcohol dehydrogenase
MWQPQSFFSQYVLRTPVILSGKEAIRGLYHYPAGKIAVIHGGSFSDAELFRSTFSKREIRFIRRSWEDEPDMKGLKGTIHELENYQPDLIIAVGGGSVIDGSKLCRLFYEFPFYEVGVSRVEGEQLKTRFIAVPTTVGSGSEVSSASVYVDRVNHRKDMVVLHGLLPDVVVYDGRYVENAPEKLLCASALDAMAHILEGYVSKLENSLMNIMAEEGFVLLVNELKKYIGGERKSIDYQRLQYAGFLGGLVQNHCIVGAAHAVAHQTAECGYAHGEAVALMLPAVIGLNSKDNITYAKYQEISMKAGFADVESMVSFIVRVCDYSGVSRSQENFREVLKKLADNPAFFDNIKQDRGGKGNPVDITDDYIMELVRSI